LKYGTVVRFSGPFLVVYSGSGNSRLVFDKEIQQIVAEDRLAAIQLPPREESPRTVLGGAISEGNTIARWKQMAIEEICDTEHCSQPPGKRAVRMAEYYMREPGKVKVLLFRINCLPDRPRFVGDEEILINLCNGKNFVVNKKGQKLYDLPRLVWPYVTLNHEGTRFVVYERDQSFFQGFSGDCCDKRRVKVFRSSDGKKLFEYHWNGAGDDGINNGRVALSDDGSLLALVRSHEVLVFTIPAT
jgi:hypothetical protein